MLHLSAKIERKERQTLFMCGTFHGGERALAVLWVTEFSSPASNFGELALPPYRHSTAARTSSNNGRIVLRQAGA